MVHPEAPPWAKQSSRLQTLIAVIGGHPDDPMFGVDKKTSDCIKTAMSVFRSEFSGSDVLGTISVTPERADTWHLEVVSKILKSFQGVHFKLINDDESYAASLGDAMDSYTEKASGRRPKPSLRRWRLDGQELLVNAIREGLAPVGAVFGVVPGVVKHHYKDNNTDFQYDHAKGLLIPAQLLAMDFARQSNDTHDAMVRQLSKPAAVKFGKVFFEKMVFDPRKFTIIETPGRPAQLQPISSSNAATDIQRPFGGCPAVKGGGVSYLSSIIREFVETHDAYAPSFYNISNAPMYIDESDY